MLFRKMYNESKYQWITVAKFTNTRKAGFQKGGHSVRESEMLVEDETQIASRASLQELSYAAQDRTKWNEIRK